MKNPLILIVALIAFAGQAFSQNTVPQEYNKNFDLSKYGIPTSINVLDGTIIQQIVVTLNMKEGEEDYMGTQVTISYRKEDDYSNVEKERGRVLVEAGKKNIILEEETAVVTKDTYSYTVYTFHQKDGWFATATVYSVDSEIKAKKLAQALKPKN
jgi:hypothetical protein